MMQVQKLFTHPGIPTANFIMLQLYTKMTFHLQSCCLLDHLNTIVDSDAFHSPQSYISLCQSTLQIDGLGDGKEMFDFNSYTLAP